MSSHQHPTANVAEIYKSVIADVINQMKESFLDENIDIDVLNQFRKEWEEKVQQSGAVEFEPRVVVQPHPIRPAIPAAVARNAGHVQIGGNARQQQQQQQQQQQLQHHIQQPQSQPVTQLVQHHPQSLQQQMIDQQQQVQNQLQQQLQQQQQAQQVQIQQAQAARPGLPMSMAYLPVQQPHQSIQQQVQVHQLQQQLGQQIQPIQVTSAPAGMSFQLAAAQGIRMVQGMQPTSQPQQFVIQTVSGPQLSHQQFIMLPNGQQIPVNLNTRIVTQNPTMHQVDGNGDEFEEEEEEEEKGPQSSQAQLEPSSSGTNSNRRQRHNKKKVNKPSRREALKVASAIMPELQLDGGGDTITDSSSEEDEVEEEEDQLRRYADSVGNGNADDGEEGDENPLNSDDDQSTDDEDLNTLFDADNVVMCQFEKVHRARNKWKFQLKDGIMHVENKDYCFQKCTGEAEW